MQRGDLAGKAPKAYEALSLRLVRYRLFPRGTRGAFRTPFLHHHLSGAARGEAEEWEPARSEHMGLGTHGGRKTYGTHPAHRLLGV